MKISVSEIRELPLVKGILLAFIMVTIFVIPVFPPHNIKYIFAFFFTGTFIFAALSLKKNRNILVGIAIILSLVIWLVSFELFHTLRTSIRFIQFIFLLMLVIGFTKQIASNSKVTGSVFLDAITGYLLLGLAFSIIVTVLSNIFPGAYNTPWPITNAQRMYETFGEFVFYTFMTFTTAGYGHIEPTLPISKSLAILISATGQLYVATIISLLIGKYVSSKGQ